MSQPAVSQHLRALREADLVVHAGFRSPDNDFAFDAMSPGWTRILQSITGVIAEAA